MVFSLSLRHHHPLICNMITERWVTAAITTDALVADLLLRLKRSSSSDSPPPPLNPPVWGDRRSRSKPSATATVVMSPSTPLSWSDGCDELSRPSDLYTGDRSAKIDLYQHPKKECEIEMMKSVLPDLNETPADE